HSAKITVFVTDQNSCTGKDSVTVSFKVCGGIGELAGVGLQIFPNPTSGIFTIEIKSPKSDMMDISILNQQGETVWSRAGVHVDGTATVNPDLGQLPQGTYLVQVSNGSGKLNRKVVIQK
ncbi:MAG: T9SS type A sorting domain-containing protein, partial [Bacteroidota bacterium]